MIDSLPKQCSPRSRILNTPEFLDTRRNPRLSTAWTYEKRNLRDRRRKIPPPPCKFPQYSWTMVIVERLIRKRGDRRVCSSARIRDTDTELLFSSQRGEGECQQRATPEGTLIFPPFSKSWRSEGIIARDKLCERRNWGAGGEEANFSRWKSTRPLVKYRETHRGRIYNRVFLPSLESG